MSNLKYKILLIALSSLFFFIITVFVIQTFANISDSLATPSFLFHLSIANFCCTFPIAISWIACAPWCSIIFIILSIGVCLLTFLKTQSGYFLIYIGYFIFLTFLLGWENKRKKDSLVINELDTEKVVEEKNILEQGLNKKSQALETFLHQYADYSKLRNVIDDFSSTLSLNKLCNLIVEHTLNNIGKGELVLLYLVDLNENSLSLISSVSIDKRRRTKIKKGDIFDQWVLKNKQQLLVGDITKDVRFDKHLIAMGDEFKSIMVTPIIHESRVVGTLRINSEKGEEFSTDDLRVLSIIGGIASSAISNALLYQKTEELAIKDSLTGLFVHRYFKERLKEEHKRVLLTKAPLTLLMADLDNFKSYNDRYGHAAGDIILRKVGDIFCSHIKENGIVARYGGEEFAVLLPKINKSEGLTLAEEIRSAIANEKFELRGIDTKITISIGVANIPDDTLDSEELIKSSDQYLYVAKKKGKNRVSG